MALGDAICVKYLYIDTALSDREGMVAGRQCTAVRCFILFCISSTLQRYVKHFSTAPRLG